MHTSTQYRVVARGGRTFARFEDGTELPIIRGGADDTPTLAELIEQAGNLDGLTDDELAQLDADLVAAAEAAADGELTDEVLADLTAAQEATEAVRAEGERRESEQAQRTEAAQAALQAIRGEQEDDGNDDGDPADADDPEAGDDPEASTDDTEPEAVEPAPAADPAPATAEAESTAEPIAASAPARRAPRLSRVNARRPDSARPVNQPADPFAGLTLVAAANAPGLTAGQPITQWDMVAKGMVEAYQASLSYRGPRQKVPVIRASVQYPDSHMLDGNTRQSTRKVEETQAAIRAQGGILAAQRNGITASGGICAPSEVRYDLPVVTATQARPVRDQFLTRFGADRGGVSTMPPPVLSDLDGAIGFWDNDNDISPDDPATKPCLTMTCPDEDETLVEAITKCIEVGNFRARYFPEQVEAWMNLAAANHARQAEEALLATISSGSIAVTAGELLGTTRNVLAVLDRAISVWRYRHRVDDSFRLSWGAPRWLRDQIRTDIARQLPVGTVDETLAVADAQIESFFTSRNVDPVWLLDGESGQRFTVQGVNALQGWPDQVKTYLAVPGTWLFLDGGTLDLGLVRDSTLNATNDAQFFSETFEGAHFHGAESWTLTIDTCPDGSVSAAVDIDPCVSGS